MKPILEPTKTYGGWKYIGNIEILNEDTPLRADTMEDIVAGRFHSSSTPAYRTARLELRMGRNSETGQYCNVAFLTSKP